MDARIALLQAARETRVVVFPATASGEANAREAAVALADGRRQHEVRIPRLEASWLEEEVAARLIDDLGVSSAAREDVAGLIDAAGEALRTAGVACLTVLDADSWLRAGGASALRRWSDATESTIFLLTANPSLAAEVSLPVVDLSRTQPDHQDEPLSREEPEWEVLAAIAAAPVPLSLRVLAAVFGERQIGAHILKLRERSLVDTRWHGGDVMLETSRRVCERVTVADPGGVAELRSRIHGAVRRLVAADVDELGDALTFARARWLTRNRALIRHVYDSAVADDPTVAPSVALAALAAIGARGPLASLLAITTSALALQPGIEVAAALHARRALLLRSLGRGAEGAHFLLQVAADAALPIATRGRLALTRETLATPELERSDLRDAARSIRSTLDRSSPRERALEARGRAVAAWTHGAARDALAAALDAMAAYDLTLDEVARLDMLMLAAVCAVGADATIALDLIEQLEGGARRAERVDLEARARGLRGCALHDAGQSGRAVIELSDSIERLAESGFHHFERWHRLHRGFALLDLGRAAEAVRDFDDFLAMTDMAGASALVGVLGGSLAGSTLARLRLPGVRDAPPYFAPYVALIEQAVSLDLGGRARLTLDLGAGSQPAVPGFYALEARSLRRALLRGRGARADETLPRKLVVASDASWFELDAEGRVSLARSRTLRKVFAGMLEARASSRALTIDDVFAIGWPGERAAASSIANRVHVTICRLRSSGLKEVVQYRDCGWGLDPDVQIVIVR